MIRKACLDQMDAAETEIRAGLALNQCHNNDSESLQKITGGIFMASRMIACQKQNPCFPCVNACDERLGPILDMASGHDKRTNGEENAR